MSKTVRCLVNCRPFDRTLTQKPHSTKALALVVDGAAAQTVTLPGYNPTTNDNRVCSTVVAGVATVALQGFTTQITPGISGVSQQTLPAIFAAGLTTDSHANPADPASLVDNTGTKCQVLTVPDPITGGTKTVTVYNNTNIVDTPATSFPVTYQGTVNGPTKGRQDVDTRLWGANGCRRYAEPCDRHIRDTHGLGRQFHQLWHGHLAVTGGHAINNGVVNTGFLSGLTGKINQPAPPGKNFALAGLQAAELSATFASARRRQRRLARESGRSLGGGRDRHECRYDQCRYKFLFAHRHQCEQSSLRRFLLD